MGIRVLLPIQLLPVLTEPRSVYAIDLDGDGIVDVLSASSYDDKIAWYENLKYYTGTTDVAVSQITVFPNPTTGNLKIDLSNIKESGQCET